MNAKFSINLLYINKIFNTFTFAIIFSSTFGRVKPKPKCSKKKFLQYLSKHW